MSEFTPVIINWEGNKLLPPDQRFLAQDWATLEVVLPVPEDVTLLTEGIVVDDADTRYVREHAYVDMLTELALFEMGDTDDVESLEFDPVGLDHKLIERMDRTYTEPANKLEQYVRKLGSYAAERRRRDF